jgi:hypothetical protein
MALKYLGRHVSTWANSLPCFKQCKQDPVTLREEWESGQRMIRIWETRIRLLSETWLPLTHHRILKVNIICLSKHSSRSQWPRGLRCRSVAQRLLGSWVRIPVGAWMFVSCTVFVLSGRGLCNGPIPRPEESYRLWCVSECDQVKIETLYTYCKQAGRRGKD